MQSRFAMPLMINASQSFGPGAQHEGFVTVQGLPADPQRDPDRWRAALRAVSQRLVDRFAIGLAGARTRRSTWPRRPPVGGHLPGNCRFFWTFTWPTAAADWHPRRAQVLVDHDAMHARRAADASKRPPQSTERENILL
jgi:hypothetical protein